MMAMMIMMIIIIMRSKFVHIAFCDDNRDGRTEGWFHFLVSPKFLRTEYSHPRPCSRRIVQGLQRQETSLPSPRGQLSMMLWGKQLQFGCLREIRGSRRLPTKYRFCMFGVSCRRGVERMLRCLVMICHNTWVKKHMLIPSIIFLEPLLVFPIWCVWCLPMWLA